MNLPYPLGRRVRVPLRLGSVETRGAEAKPAELGVSRLRLEAAWRATQLLYRTGLHPGISLVVRHRGEVVLDRALGHRTWHGEEPMTSSTPACLFSCSKAVTAALVHALVDEGLIELDAPLARYVEEFAQNGKDTITVRDVLAHRAGLSAAPIKDLTFDQVFDWDLMVEALCRAKPDRHGRQAYHAVTGGYLLGELVTRVTGLSLSEALRTRITGPLGLETMTYGVPEHARGHVALSYATGPASLPLITPLVKRVLGVIPDEVAAALSSREGMDAVVPAANVYASAHDLTSLFQMLLNHGQHDGREVLSADAVAEAVRPVAKRVIDATIPVPLRFSSGFILGERGPSLYGIGAPHAFGHLGYTNIVAWADPERDLAATLITTGKAVSLEGVAGMAAVTAAVTAAVPGSDSSSTRRRTSETT